MRLPAVSVKIVMAMRLDIVVILYPETKSKLNASHRKAKRTAS